MSLIHQSAVSQWQSLSVTKLFFEILERYKKDATDSLIRGQTLSKADRALLDTAQIIGRIDAFDTIVNHIIKEMRNDEK